MDRSQGNGKTFLAPVSPGSPVSPRSSVPPSSQNHRTRTQQRKGHLTVMKGSATPFLRKTYDILQSGRHDTIIRWWDDTSLIVLDPDELERKVLPAYFKHGNFLSFMRQLHMYGFRKSDSGRWIFSNELFCRGDESRLAQITRRNRSRAFCEEGEQAEGEEEEEEEDSQRRSSSRRSRALENQQQSLLIPQLEACVRAMTSEVYELRTSIANLTHRLTEIEKRKYPSVPVYPPYPPVTPSAESLASDWFTDTSDPAPLFTEQAFGELMMGMDQNAEEG